MTDTTLPQKTKNELVAEMANKSNQDLTEVMRHCLELHKAGKIDNDSIDLITAKLSNTQQCLSRVTQYLNQIVV